MRYFLMHKAVEVAELTIDESHGGISSIDKVQNSEHFPVGVFTKGNAAALLATDGTLYVTDSSIDTNSGGGAGAFAYGDGTVYIADSKITTQQKRSRRRRQSGRP